MKGRDHLEDVDVYGKVILECILWRNRVGRCGLDASSLHRDQWRAYMNTVMNIRVP